MSLKNNISDVVDAKTEAHAFRRIARCQLRTLAVEAFDNSGQQMPFNQVQPGFTNVASVEIQWLEANGGVVDRITYRPIDKANLRYLVVGE